VLTPDSVAALVAEVHDLMDRDAPTVRGQIQETERQIARVEEAIDNLLDVTERFGADSAGPRLAEREAERAQLQARLQQLVAQQEDRAPAISLEMVQDMLTKMHGTLTDGDLQAKRALLSKVVARIDMGREGAGLSYTFPLRE
jgi:BMFP domain-containing protein YqiC